MFPRHFPSCAALIFATAWISIGCVARSDKEVVIYTSVDREFAAPILDAFERSKEPLEVVRQFDIESTKTVGLVTRIIEESKKPRCDVFWNSEILHTIRLQKQGLLRQRRWKIPDSWPKGFRASDGSWVGFAARARILLINREKLPDSTQWPKSVMELADVRWKDQCAIAYPMFGTTTTHFAVLRARMGNEASTEWFGKVSQNAKVLSGNKQVAQAVAAGQVAWGLTDTDDAMIEKENGMKVEVIFPDQQPDEMGTLFIPNTICVLEKGPNPTSGGQLADYLISQDIEERLTMGSSAQFAVWPSSNQKSKAQPAQPVRWAEVDFEKAAELWSELTKELPAIFDRRTP